MKIFTVSEAISFGWNTFKSNWKFWIMVWMLISLGGMSSGNFSSFGNGGEDLDMRLEEFSLPMEDYSSDSLIGFAGSSVLGEDTVKGLPQGVWTAIFIIGPIVLVIGLAFVVLSMLVSMIFTMGYLNVTLDAARGKQVYYKTLLNQVSLKKAYRMLIAMGLSGVITVFGFLFFIIPGFYFMLRFMFVPLVVVDEDLKPLDALGRSGDLTKGIKGELFGLGLAFLGLSLLGVLAFGVGAIVVGIVSSISLAYVYVKSLESKSVPVPEAVPSIQ